MKQIKSLLALMLLIGFSLSSFAASSIDSPDKTTLSSELKELIKDIDFSSMNTGETIYVDFIITNRNEVIVLSTNTADFDKTIKSKLNYHVIESENVAQNETYTLPIVIKK